MTKPSEYNPQEIMGLNVQYWRTKRKLSGQNLADRVTRLGLQGFGTKSSISHVENGKRTVGIDDLFIFAQALNVSPLALITPNEDVVIEGKVTSPERVAMWLRMIVPLPISGTTQERIDHGKKFLQSLPAHELRAFEKYEGLHDAWVALANVIGNLADEDIEGAEFRTFALIKNLSQVFDIITKERKQEGSLIILATGENNLLTAEWQAIRDERDDLLDRLEVNQQRSRQIERQALENKGQI